MRRYLPWWRGAGAATLVSTVDATGIASRASLTLQSEVNGRTGTAVAARLYGPGEVGSLDPRQVIRTDPPPGTLDFEPHLFPVLELDSPELPWFFTPARADGAQHLRPWLVLVAVRESSARLETQPGRPLPVLAVADAGQELPDLDQSWAWVHVQIAGPGDPVAVLSGGDPRRTLARLLCPRRLEADTAYVAALVPAFLQGLQAGLGAPVDPGVLQPAWTPATTSVELPAYYSWRFSTGVDGDFEQLVARLTPTRLSAQDLSGLPVDVSDTPAGLPDAGVIRVPGALGVGGSVPVPVDPAVAQRLLELSELPRVGTFAPVPAGLPLPLPAYGRWHAGRRARTSLESNGWLAQLNVHPAARSVAALGTRIVQRDQEHLMAAAWQQVGQVLAVNAMLRGAQLGRAGSGALYSSCVRPLPDVDLLVVAGPVLGRVLYAGSTVEAQLGRTQVPGALFSTAARRLLRPRGPLGRRSTVPIRSLAQRAGEVPLPVGQPVQAPAGMVSADDVRTAWDLPALCSTRSDWWRRQPLPTHRLPRELAAALRGPFLAHAGGRGPCTAPPPAPPLDAASVADTVRAALDPEVSIVRRVRARLSLPAGWDPEDPLEPVLAAPDFPTPMFRSVAAEMPELLLPGVDRLPTESLWLVGTNPWFVAALMVGLNAEMGRELLWRGYPTDQRGTCFRRFWDRTAAVPPMTGEELDDIRPIASWRHDLPLHVAGLRAPDPLPDPLPAEEASQAVLGIRGELLSRFPGAVVYAVAARWPADPQAERVPQLDPAAPPLHPRFTAALPPDISLLGFDLSPVALRGDDDSPGYHLVFAEQPYETRYGLDLAPPTAPTGRWGDLSWQDVTLTASGHVRLGADDPIAVPADPRGLHFTSAANSASVAAIVEQRPYRVVIHASTLLPSPVQPGAPT